MITWVVDIDINFNDACDLSDFHQLEIENRGKFLYTHIKSSIQDLLLLHRDLASLAVI